jgi:hypothetical protein
VLEASADIDDVLLQAIRARESVRPVVDTTVESPSGPRRRGKPSSTLRRSRDHTSAASPSGRETA